MFSTPDLCDEFPNDVYACELQFRSFGEHDRFSGQIETIKCFEDNSLVKQALAEPGNGRVLVVDGGASLRRALLGDQIALSAVKQGWSGLVFNGAVRDVDDLNTLGIGVKALGCCPLKTEKRGEGQRSIDLHFGGVQFSTGHYLYADNNGVVVSKNNLLLNSG